MSVRLSTGSAALGLLLVAGCGGSNASGDGVLRLHDPNNYLSTSALMLPTVVTAPATDLDICWTDVTTDLQCHPVAPRVDIDNVGFLRFIHLSQADVQAKLVSGELTQSQIDGYVEYPTDHVTTCAKLSQFSFFGTPIDLASHYVESADETYMLVFTHGTQAGVGARVMTFVKPAAGSTNTRVDAPAGCGLLDFAVDLTTPEPIEVSPTGPWPVDWRAVTRNGQGSPVVYATIDRLLVGFYAGMTVSDLEARFFDLETLATALWELPLAGGREAELGRAIERGTGAAFPGFLRRDGVWMMALLCGTCQNPSPVVLTILVPRGGA